MMMAGIQFLELLFAKDAVIHKLCPGTNSRTQENSNHQTNATQLEPIGEAGFHRQAGRIKDAEVFALLPQFHAGGHFRSVLLFQQLVIIRFGLLVAAGQVCELLLAHRFLVQARLVHIDLRLESLDGVLSIRDLDLIRLQLSLDLKHRTRVLKLGVISGHRARAGICLGIARVGFQASDEFRPSSFQFWQSAPSVSEHPDVALCSEN